MTEAGVTATSEHTPHTTYDSATYGRLRAEAEVIVARYPVARSALLPMLHLVQSEDAFVSPRGIALCADVLGLSTAEVSAVATFYSQYKRRPNGEYTVGVCTNTLCAVMGGDEIFARLSEHLGIGHDQTTDDGAVTLERVECNAACDYAPVVMVNWEFFDNQTPTSVVDVVDRLRAGEDVAPTRGAAKVCTFREVSRVLAGFPDGRAEEGVGAGPATLEGLRLAREHGWSAPEFPPPPAPPQPPAKAAPARAASPRTASPRTTSTRARTAAATAPAAAAQKAPAADAPSTQPPATQPPAASTEPQAPATPRTRTTRAPRSAAAQPATETPTAPATETPAGPARAPRARRTPAKATTEPAPAEATSAPAEAAPSDPETPKRPAARRPAARTTATTAPAQASETTQAGEAEK